MSAALALPVVDMFNNRKKRAVRTGVAGEDDGVGGGAFCAASDLTVHLIGLGPGCCPEPDQMKGDALRVAIG